MAVSNKNGDGHSNTLLSLNDKLFEQLERLGDKSLKGEELKEEISRCDAFVDISKVIIENANTLLRARIAKDEKLGGFTELPRMLNE